MNRMFIMCQKIVELNTNVRDQETIDLLATSIMAIILDRGSEVLDKIPGILRTINIISDNRSVIEVEHQDLNNYREDDALRDADACVTRMFKFKDNKYFENKYLIIPKKNIRNYPVSTVEQTTHELIHLLRFQKAVRKGDNIIFQEGISTKTLNIKSHITYRKNYMLEESIVQTYTKQAMTSLFDYTDELKSDWFRKINRDKHSFKFTAYDSHVKLLDRFMEDDTFKDLVEDTFSNSTHTYLEKYYNGVMDDDLAFTRLNNFFNKLEEELEVNNTDQAKKFIACILHEHRQFSGHKQLKK